MKALGLTPTHHVVGGASKRGWNTWLVGAVDPRVIGIVPIVMDELNFMENIKHHYRSLGGDPCPLPNPRMVVCPRGLLENEPHHVLWRS